MHLPASKLPANLQGTKILHWKLPAHHLNGKAAWLPRSSFGQISRLVATPWMISRRGKIVSYMLH